MKKTYKQDFLDNLIKVSKKILVPPKKEMKLEGKHHRNDFKLESVDREYQFSVFLRQSIDFAENFSIGLIYCPPDDETITLCRFNGPHGGWEDSPFHLVPHIHLAKQENIEKGLTPEKMRKKLSSILLLKTLLFSL